MVADPDMDAVSQDEMKLLSDFPSIMPTGALICAAGGLNHYLINHTTGQGKLQGFALKVAKILGLVLYCIVLYCINVLLTGLLHQRAGFQQRPACVQ